MNKFNIELFRKTIIGLNSNLEIVGEEFHKNIHLIASDANIEIKEKAIDNMADEIAKTLPRFKENYNDLAELYIEVDTNIQEKTEDKEEYISFISHVKEVFPNYIKELNQSVESMSSLEIKTAKFNETMGELSKILLSIAITFEKFLAISDKYLN
ncbi:hypothetical protein LJB96_03190 [Methanobrevibacter sp. OttesenSCG-928-K11]|nr:hypothetical protein [Methanobrevibacter sp. OttesenSCG-928-K11]MDL2270782.1 hypothetical protein [Methanobrevibacter sp. OttesenSCG-928-I08]